MSHSIRVKTIEDAAYERAVEAVRQAGVGSIQTIQAATRASYNGAQQFLARMEDEGIVGAPREDGTREVLTP